MHCFVFFSLKIHSEDFKVNLHFSSIGEHERKQQINNHKDKLFLPRTESQEAHELQIMCSTRSKQPKPAELHKNCDVRAV